MKLKSIDGQVYKLVPASENAVSNEEHFKHDLWMLLLHYQPILDYEEIEDFIRQSLFGLKIVHPYSETEYVALTKNGTICPVSKTRCPSSICEQWVDDPVCPNRKKRK
jgi:hypothetical protein